MNKIRMIEFNLSKTIDTMNHTLGQVSMRGLEVDEIEKNSEKLLESSNEFVYKFIPWYERLWYNLWCCPKWWNCQWRREEMTETISSHWVEV